LIIKDVPELRIIEQGLWDRVKERQRTLADKLETSARKALSGRSGAHVTCSRAL
jgi:hypothetical protein